MKRWIVALIFALVPIAYGQQEESLSLTLRECIERALAHNLDISIERINPQIEQGNIMAAQGDFDPHLQITLNRQDIESPLFVVQTNSAANETRLTIFDSSLIGKLPSGTAFDLSYNTTSQSTSPDFVNQEGAVGVVSITQPLLRNFGLTPNLAPIRIARKNKQIAVFLLAGKVTDTINEVHKAYFDLIFAIENLKVQMESLELAKALLAENKKRLEVGLMSPIDVTQAESGVALQEEAVITAQQTIRNQANRLRKLISADVASLRQTRIVPVDPPSVEPVAVNVEHSIQLGLQNRPEYLQQMQQIERNKLQLGFDRNQLLPQVDFTGSYGQAGLSPHFSDTFDIVASRDGSPQWLIGVVVDIPLGDIRARGTFRASKLRLQQAMLTLKNVEQTIIVDVDNAAVQVETNLKRIEATRAASRLAEETLNAERKKLEAGTSTSYAVLLHQRDLTDARSKEIRAIADYNESLADLYRAEGTLLQKNNITVKAE